MNDLGVVQPAAFLLAVLVLNATPGVDMLLTASRSLQSGWRAGMAAAIGVCTGAAVHACLAAFGLAAVLALFPAAFAALKWAGCAYLAWLGLSHLRRAWLRSGEGMQTAGPGPEAAARVCSHTDRWPADFRRGLLTNLLNPKIALFFLAFVPQFIAPTASHPTATFLLLGAWMSLQSLVFLIVWVSAVATVRRWPRPGWVGRAMHVASGVLFVGMAVRLARSRLTGP